MSTKTVKQQASKAARPNEQPGADWIPIDRAAFYYMPEYTGRGHAWVAAIAERVSRYLSTAEITCEPTLGELFIARSGGLEFQVDPQAGTFWLEIINPEVEFVVDARQKLRFPPRRFISEFQSRRLKPEFEVPANRLFRLALTLYGNMDWLDCAIEAGYAVIMARQGSPSEDFSPVRSDQWRYFKLSSDMEAVAVGPSGERLFSVFVAPGPKRRTTRASTASAKADCQKWLASQMRRSPVRTQPKETFRAQATELFPKLSRRSFDAAWAEAIETTEAYGWHKAGRPRKSPQ